MKRCPKCEFIYEDDQSLCDMDGALLVFDSRTLPNLHALDSVEAKPAPRRNRMVPAFASLILALVLGLVYYVSTERNAALDEASSIPAVIVSTPVAEVAVPAPVAPAVEPEPAPERVSATENVHEKTKRAASKPAAATPSANQAPVKTVPVQTKTSTKKKDESKVGSMLKKTGRILKKPFKF